MFAGSGGARSQSLPRPIYEVGLVKPATANFARRSPRTSSSPSASVGPVPTARPARCQLASRTAAHPQSRKPREVPVSFFFWSVSWPTRQTRPTIYSGSLSQERRHEKRFRRTLPFTLTKIHGWSSGSETESFSKSHLVQWPARRLLHLSTIGRTIGCSRCFKLPRFPGPS